MMKPIGKKEIKEALDNIVLSENQYKGCYIDYMILKYYNLPKNTLLEDVTQASHEFNCISDVYEYIDSLLNEKGYFSDDLDLYKKRSDK